MGCITLKQLTEAVFAITEKDTLRSADIKCVFSNADSPVGELSPDAIKNLYDCARGGHIVFNKLVGPLDITTLFDCPQYIKEIQTYITTGAACPSPGMVVEAPIYSVIETDGTLTNLGAAETALLVVPRKILGFVVTFLGEQIGASIAKFIVRSFGEKRVSAPRDAPLYVRTVDRVIAADVQRVIAIREQETVELNPIQIQAFFDGSKDTCLAAPFTGGGGWLTGDEIVVVFNEPIQAHNIEVTETVSRQVGSFNAPMSSDFIGDFEWAFADQSLPNGSILAAYFAPVAAKISAFSFIFGADVDEICEIVVKTFTHNDIDCNCP